MNSRSKIRKLLSNPSKIIYLKDFKNFYEFIKFVILKINYKFLKVIYITYIIIYHIIEFIFISEKDIY